MADGPVPTVEAFRASIPKPEAFESISDDVVLAALERKTDYLAAAFGDRAILPITSWSKACDDAVFAFVARALIGYRGYKRDGTGDSEYVALDLEAKEFRKGIKDKTEHPTIVDSNGNGLRPDSPRITSSARSDDWTRRRRTCGPCR